MPHTRTSTAGRVLAVIGFAGVGVAAAQDANAPATQKLPDIVVTATRTEQSSFDVPASIDSVAIGDATDTLARQSFGIPRNRSGRARARSAELRAGRADLDPRLRRALDVRRARRAPVHRRHSGDDARRAGAGLAFQSRFGRSRRSAARTVLRAVRQFVRRRDPALHRRRQRSGPRSRRASSDRATTPGARASTRAACTDPPTTTSTSRISRPTAIATTAQRSANPAMASSTSRSVTAAS